MTQEEGERVDWMCEACFSSATLFRFGTRVIEKIATRSYVDESVLLFHKSQCVCPLGLDFE